jgi:tetratricopeptide (TPR) repeat protein
MILKLLDSTPISGMGEVSVLDNHRSRVHYLWGEVYLEKEMVDEAISAYEKVLRHDPGYAMAYHRLGMIYHQMGKREEAINNLERFIQLWGGEPEQIRDVVKLLEELKTK